MAKEEEKDDTPDGPSAGQDVGPVGLEFSDFLLSVATNAVMHLGGEDDGSEGVTTSGRVDLALAAQHIDIVVMLKEKTKGNLEDHEARLLDSLLYDLRMRYLQVAQAHASQA